MMEVTVHKRAMPSEKFAERLERLTTNPRKLSLNRGMDGQVTAH